MDLTAKPRPCAGCPWTSRAERDRIALTPAVRAAAERGEWFCCHVHMGDCIGAANYGAAKRARSDATNCTPAG